MKQEENDLLLKDLCARLPYGVKAYVKHWSKIDRKYYEDTYDVKSVFPSLNEVHVQSKSGSVDVLLGYSDYNIKPYLFPLSSMTEEQTEEVHNLIYQGISESVDETSKWLKTRKENELRPITLTYILNYKLVIDWFNKNHFDYRGLIEKGLALDATGLNIY